MKVYLNGEFLEKKQAGVSVDDRGFLLADGVYEVTAVYGGEPFRLDRHLARLADGLKAVGIVEDVWRLEAVHGRLLEANGLASVPTAKVYVQVTRGSAPRSHAFPSPAPPPTVFAAADAMDLPGDDRWEAGFTAITVPDRRWSRVDIKSIALLPNVLAQQAAAESGVDEAIQIRDGVALEGAHANLFVVREGVVITHPKTNHILPGITREAVIECARGQGLPVEERPILSEALAGSDEVFLTGTTVEVRPIVRVDGTAIGDGVPGPVTRRLFDAYRRLVGA